MKSEALRGDLQSPSASHRRTENAKRYPQAPGSTPVPPPTLSCLSEWSMLLGRAKMSPPDMTIGTTLLFSQRSLSWMASTCLCSVRSYLLQGRPCCLLLPNPTTLGSEMPSQSGRSPDLVSTPSSRSRSGCPATGVRLLPGFCHGPPVPVTGSSLPLGC